MQIVIRISDSLYDKLIDMNIDSDTCSFNESVLVESIQNGTPLQKEHGRLSDMDELVKNIVKEYDVNSIHELPQDIKTFYDKFINSAPTILDAAADYKLKNYAFIESEEE